MCCIKDENVIELQFLGCRIGLYNIESFSIVSEAYLLTFDSFSVAICCNDVQSLQGRRCKFA